MRAASAIAGRRTRSDPGGPARQAAEPVANGVLSVMVPLKFASGVGEPAVVELTRTDAPVAMATSAWRTNAIFIALALLVVVGLLLWCSGSRPSAQAQHPVMDRAEERSHQTCVPGQAPLRPRGSIVRRSSRASRKRPTHGGWPKIERALRRSDCPCSRSSTATRWRNCRWRTVRRSRRRRRTDPRHRGACDAGRDREPASWRNTPGPPRSARARLEDRGS